MKPLKHNEIIGKIVELYSSNVADGGYIKVHCKTENKPAEIRINLSPDQYQLAVEAHQKGQQIRYKGENLYINRKDDDVNLGMLSESIVKDI